MPTEKIKLLIVDDTVPICALLAAILTESGYAVRAVEDGLSALAAIRREVPDLILSDLYMPAMSGFELLSVIRRRFPWIPAIAMSSMYSHDDVPPGIAADAYYEKGTAVSYLLEMIEALTESPRQATLEHSSASAPIWIPRNGHDPSGEPYVMISCPECLRAFPQALNEDARTMHETDCIHCHALIHFAIVQSGYLTHPVQEKRRKAAQSAAPSHDGMLRFPRAQ